MTKTLLALAAGFAGGYVLGAKAGRERYDQLVQAAQAATTTTQVTAGVAKTAADVASSAASATRKAVGKVRGDREIQLPDAEAILDDVTPPSTP